MRDNIRGRVSAIERRASGRGRAAAMSERLSTHIARSEPVVFNLLRRQRVYRGRVFVIESDLVITFYLDLCNAKPNHEHLKT